MATDTLYFQGYKTPEPGDTIPVWRNDWCCGHIACTQLVNGNDRAAPVQFTWTLAAGNQFRRNQIELNSYEEAKEEICKAFVALCTDLGLVVAGPSVKPRSLSEDFAKVILSNVKMRTDSASVINYMKSHPVQRMLGELDKEDRGRVGREAKAYGLELQKKEQEALDAAVKA